MASTEDVLNADSEQINETLTFWLGLVKILSFKVFWLCIYHFLYNGLFLTIL